MTVGLWLRQFPPVLWRMVLLLSLSTTLTRPLGASEGAWLVIDSSEPAACLNEEQLGAETLAVLGTDAPPSGLAVRIIEADAGARFELVDEGRVVAERSFDELPDECAERTRTLAVAIAIAIENFIALAAESEPEVAAPATTGAPPVDTEGASPQSTEQEEPATEEDEPSRSRAAEDAPSGNKRRFRLGIGPAIVGGVLPKIAAGGAVSFGYIFGQKRLFSVDVGGVLTPNVKSVLGRGHIKSRLVAGQVHGCFEPVLGPVKVEGCAGLAAGRLAASATGLLNARSAASAWVAGLLRGGIRVPAQGRFGVHAAVDGTLNILRPGVAVAVEGGEPVEDNAPLFGYSGVLEAVWTFP